MCVSVSPRARVRLYTCLSWRAHVRQRRATMRPPHATSARIIDGFPLLWYMDSFLCAESSFLKSFCDVAVRSHADRTRNITPPPSILRFPSLHPSKYNFFRYDTPPLAKQYVLRGWGYTSRKNDLKLDLRLLRVHVLLHISAPNCALATKNTQGCAPPIAQ